MITSDSQFGENKQLPWTTNDEKRKKTHK